MRELLLGPALVGAALAAVGLAAGGLVAVLDGSSGIRASLELRAELREARARIQAVREETERLRREAASLERDDFAVERAIREDLGLARAGETLVRWSGDDPSSLRFH